MVSTGGRAVWMVGIGDLSAGLLDSSSEKSSTVTPGTTWPFLLVASKRTVELDLFRPTAGVEDSSGEGEAAISAVFQLSF